MGHIAKPYDAITIQIIRPAEIHLVRTILAMANVAIRVHGHFTIQHVQITSLLTLHEHL